MAQPYTKVSEVPPPPPSGIDSIHIFCVSAEAELFDMSTGFLYLLHGKWDNNKVLFFFICHNLPTKETGTVQIKWMEDGWME